MISGSDDADRQLSSADLDQQQCMLYLLGEMSAADSLAFEQRLSESPRLNRELLIQAELLTALSSCQEKAAPVLTAPVLTAPISAVPISAATVSASPSPGSWKRWVAVVSSLAAAMMLAVAGYRLLGTHQSTTAEQSRDSSGEETLKIAQAWATAGQQRVELLQQPAVELDWATEESAEQRSAWDDAVPSWMVAAVAADDSSSAQQGVTTSDG
ncbi:MAG: hypothetical protein MI861_29055 [Pirellulales bacterium]|nr:hypothetical protein [Pirellulales bacterium]